MRKLTQKETLAMFRNTCYSGMGIRKGEDLPTDSECIQWLTRLRLHAEKLQVTTDAARLGMLPYWREWIKQPLAIGQGQ